MGYALLFFFMSVQLLFSRLFFRGVGRGNQGTFVAFLEVYRPVHL